MKTRIFLLLFCLSSLFTGLNAQSGSKAIPLNPDVRTGTLPNGIRYYILKNAKPEKRAELRLALNAGALLENDDQQGLAHFCEHMCFNGTKNFPKAELVNYLESIGTKFGAHLNAYTSFEETVYMLQVPTDNDEIFNKAFLVLEDWAHNVTFDGAEIDKERGVVVSERRNGLGGDKRVFDRVYPVQMKGSRYAERLPIGKLEVLESFAHDKVRSFYKDWYRPDLMAVMAVGDFDLDRVEAQIKQHFSGLSNPENERPLVSYPVPDHEEQLVVVASDREATRNSVSIMFKQPKVSIATEAELRTQMTRNLCNEMMNQRLEEIRQQPNPPFAFGFGSYSNMNRSKSSFGMTMGVSDKQINSGLETMFTEIERLRRHGFTAGELERAKKEMLKRAETAYNERDKSSSGSLINGMVGNFLRQSPFSGPTYLLDFYKKHMDEIKVEETNSMFKSWITDGKNSVITVQTVEKDGLVPPTEAEIRDLFAKIKKADIAPYKDEVMTKPLMANKPSLGKITKEKYIPELDATELTFSNGAKVVLKQTNFKNDEIQFSCTSPGGTSLYEIKDNQNANFSAYAISQSGLGDLTETELNKYMAGKRASTFFYVGEREEGGSGNFSVADLETGLQLINLAFTQPRKDKTSFDAAVQQQATFLENKNGRPETVFSEAVMKTLYNDHPRRQPETAEGLKKISMDRAYDIYKERFGNAGDFSFFFVGNFDKMKMKELLAQYIGSLPAGKKETAKDTGVRTAKMPVAQEVKKGSEPKGMVRLVYTGDAKYSLKNNEELQAFVKLLSIKLREAIREDKGGTYGVQVYAYMEKEPVSTYMMNISFGCDPGRTEELTQTALKVIDEIRASGAAEADMVKIRETKRRELETNFKENSYWMNTLNQVWEDKLNPKEFANMDAVLKYTNALQSKDYQKMAQKYLDPKKLGKFTMLPEVVRP